MTDHPTNSQASGAQEPVIVIPVSLLHHVRNLKLSGTQYDLWLYLYELDPYGNKWVEVPSPTAIAQLLKVDARTVQRCAQRLADCNLFELEIKRWKVRNTTVTVKTHDFSTGKEIHKRTNRSKSRQWDQNVGNGIFSSNTTAQDAVKPSPDQDSENGQCTNNRSTDFKEQIGSSTAVLNEQREGLVQAPELIELVIAAGLHPNQTIQRVIRELHQSLTPVAARRAVENALSAVTEQMAAGSVRNPGGLLVAALRKGFTANSAKQRAKKQQGSNGHPAKGDRPKISASNPSKSLSPPPNEDQIIQAVTQAVVTGDRTFAYGKLQALWNEGHHDLIREMCHLWRRHWGFVATDNGIIDEQNQPQDQNMTVKPHPSSDRTHSNSDNRPPTTES